VIGFISFDFESSFEIIDVLGIIGIDVFNIVVDDDDDDDEDIGVDTLVDDDDVDDESKNPVLENIVNVMNTPAKIPTTNNIF
jgi:hypothetical protein